MYNQPQGIIESPDYPLFYPIGADCIYSFFAPDGQVAKFYFDDFGLAKPNDSVCIDYLALYNSQNITDSNLIGK